MKVQALRKALEALQWSDLAPLTDLLSSIDDVDVRELADAIKNPVTKLNNAYEKKNKTKRELNNIVAAFVSELQGAATDNAAFEAIVDRIKRAKIIKVTEAAQIANAFLGSNKDFSSKPEAAKAILKRQIGDKRAQTRKAQSRDLF